MRQIVLARRLSIGGAAAKKDAPGDLSNLAIQAGDIVSPLGPGIPLFPLYGSYDLKLPGIHGILEEHHCESTLAYVHNLFVISQVFRPLKKLDDAVKVGRNPRIPVAQGGGNILYWLTATGTFWGWKGW
jgi:hypothetical protein